MDLLKKIGQVCRLHYEKIILTIALLALAGTVLYLYGAKGEEQRNIEKFLQGNERVSVKSVKVTDMAPYQTVLKGAESPSTLVFSGPHNLLNPVKWQRKPDGGLVKVVSGKEVGADAMIATRFIPITLTLNYDKVAGTGYYISVTNEAATNAFFRRKEQRFATLNSQNKIPGSQAVFILREVKGPVEDPAELVVELSDSGERVSLGKDKPYTRIEGYAVDLKYPLENLTFLAQRVGSTLRFAGDVYTVVAVTKEEVVLSGSNDKRYQVRLAK
ncbi:MAG TPA: hypothetical protein VGK40_11425 [Verrucomicrobiae bacterium]|jgi:hypothetical protein